MNSDLNNQFKTRPMARISIRSELSRSLIVALCLTMGALLMVVNWGIGQISHEYIQSRLKHDAESIIAALQLQPGTQTWVVGERGASTVFQRALSGHYYLITGQDIEIRSRSLWDYPADFGLLSQGEEKSFEMPGANDQNWMVWQLGFSKNDTPFTLTIIEDSSPLDALKWRYSLWALLVLACGAISLFFMQQWILTRNFRYLDSVRQKIQSFRYAEDKPDLSTVPQELAPLADDIDQLLQQLKQRVSRSRNALGNLAHEIKRPLQRLQQLQDESANRFAPDIKALLDDIQWLIQRELKRARIVGVSSPGRQTNLAVDLPPLINILGKLYPAIRIETDFTAVETLPQDRDDMLELIGNLLDNACKYGLSEVRLTVKTFDDRAVVCVQDDGKGLPQESIENLLQRGQRLDERQEGAGLGLSICNDIIESYQGRLTLENRKPHGIMVTIELPLR
ncbi:sensor histidine kinase [uncultured Amphritea sp.]|uniref:sensor histidine kinase n=1 Tax=uncultured Amphritea sp. TaxID=981605 RepID=UPI0025F6E8FE|nr:sensor histidine kinase [uncultured Amphritea sp.]